MSDAVHQGQSTTPLNSTLFSAGLCWLHTNTFWKKIAPNPAARKPQAARIQRFPGCFGFEVEVAEAFGGLHIR